MSTLIRLFRPARLVLLISFALLLWLLPSQAVPRAAAAGPYLYVPGDISGNVVVSNLDGSSPVNKGNLAGTVKDPVGIAIDVKNQQMYVSSWNLTSIPHTFAIVRANLDGSSPTPLSFPAGVLDTPTGLALDVARGKLYIANYGHNTIVKADLDGSDAVELNLGSKLSGPTSIALDTAYEWMYVTSFQDGNIVRASLDGTGANAITFNPAITLNKPYGIVLDHGLGYMYITTFGNNHLIRSDMNGNYGMDLGNPGNLLSGPSGIAVDNQNSYLYIASSTNNRVVRTDLSGGHATNLTAQPGWPWLLSSPRFLAFDNPPDLDVSLSSNAAAGIPAGSGFDWTLDIDNYGANPAVFAAGETIVKDYLPAGAGYVVNYRTAGITNKGALQCSVTSNVLTCTPAGAAVSFNPGAGHMEVYLAVSANAAGVLTNPTGGVCQADPDHLEGETNTANDYCSDTVTVYPPNIARGRKLYVANGTSNISRGNLDGSGGTNLGNPGTLVDRAYAIALDLNHGKMYIASNYNSQIVRANLDGTGGQDLGNLGNLLHSPVGLALDVAGGRMYITSSYNNRIVRANLDGGDASVLVDLTGKVDAPDGIALDLVHSRIYVAGHFTDNIYRMNLDGTNGENLGDLGGQLQGPRGVAVDAVHGKMYITSTYGKVLRANLDGTGVEDFGDLGGHCPDPAGVALDVAGGKMYIGCAEPSGIIRANLDGSSPQDLGDLNGSVSYPNGLALDLTSVVYLPFLRR